ncbi:putative Flagellar associated protein [metagenome]|uniref:Putative Flagellar associated protein n=1 Tax=metagenome TaxID=256318 RepID=A0A2P2C5V2_9ZZZZ
MDAGGTEPALNARPVITSGWQGVAVTIGFAVLVVGAIAVFTTDNAVGSAALVTSGLLISTLAVFANHISAIEGAGVKLSMRERAGEALANSRAAAANGDVEQADADRREAERLLLASGAVASRYEALRLTQPSGWDRTSRFEDLMRVGREQSAGLTQPHLVSELFATGTDGNRVYALALIQGNPVLAEAEPLAEAIVRPRSAFEQYQALVAAQRSVDLLADPGRDQVLSAVQEVLAGPLGQSSSDRRTVARHILEKSGSA